MSALRAEMPGASPRPTLLRRNQIAATKFQSRRSRTAILHSSFFIAPKVQ
jgi:uncharacterized ferritin-like protein (DUF455 family)